MTSPTDAVQYAADLAERDARVFIANAWPMPEEWPLSWEAAVEALGTHRPSDRRLLVSMLRAAGERRWFELRPRA